MNTAQSRSFPGQLVYSLFQALCQCGRLKKRAGDERGLVEKREQASWSRVYTTWTADCGLRTVDCGLRKRRADANLVSRVLGTWLGLRQVLRTGYKTYSDI